MKKIIAVNGYAGSGKTTFTTCCSTFLKENYPEIPVILTSTVLLVKQYAKKMGWNEEKDLKGRDFLAGLKNLLDDYNNFTFKYISSLNTKTEEGIIFIDAREPKDLLYIKENFNSCSVFIDRQENNRPKFSYTNEADKNVKQYKYDYIIDNNSSLYILSIKAENFIKEILKGENYDN